uniref:ATP-dependent DNA helicase n=1 Tax=Lactuca sativa TaxID=4236 RepID=A0A9R1VP94_LACSA|nr:hypothetical protein LSAT_V11C400192250 [Lactuca sativa]
MPIQKGYHCSIAIYLPQSFGGKTILFGGDFRQILQAIQSGNHSDTVQGSYSSKIWHECTVLCLTFGCLNNDLDETKTFNEWILKIGEDNTGCSNDGEVEIEFPEDVAVHSTGDHIHLIIPILFEETIYSSVVLNGFKTSRISNHKLTLKIGVPVMLLRNIDQTNGLCNGTILLDLEDTSLKPESYMLDSSTRIHIYIA